MLQTEAKQLKVAMRRVGRGDGDPITEMTVQCPAARERRFIDGCVRCEHYRGLVLGPEGGGSFLRCAWQRQAAPTGLPKEPPRGAQATASTTPISQIMTTAAVTVPPTMTLDSLISVFLERQISGIPVVDEHGRPIGMVSKTDVLRERYDADLERRDRWSDVAWDSREEDLVVKDEPATVDDVMTRFVFILPETAPIAMAAALMVSERVHRVPVVRPDGRMAGILTSLDVMQWLARREGYILEAESD